MSSSERDYASMTREELYSLAQHRDIVGRSELSKDELIAAHELEDTGPDAVGLLVRQHDEIRRLFNEFDELSDRPSKRKADVVRELITVLVKHAEVEEQVFYPAIRDEVDGQRGQVDESLEEHHAMELLLFELDKMTPESDRFDAKVMVLKANTLHHIEEEEQDLFPDVVAGLPEDRRRELGSTMETLWRLAPTRPHPHSPDTPPGNILAGLPATALDLTVGTVRTVRRLIRRG